MTDKAAGTRRRHVGVEAAEPQSAATCGLRPDAGALAGQADLTPALRLSSAGALWAEADAPIAEADGPRSASASRARARRRAPRRYGLAVQSAPSGGVLYAPQIGVQLYAPQIGVPPSD